MELSENKKIVNETESKLLPEISNSVDNHQSRKDEKKPINKASLKVNTSNIESSFQKIPSASARSSTATPMTSTLRRPQTREIPADTRPDRTQRPEDLKRAQYLGASNIENKGEKNISENKKKKRSNVTCWTTFSRAMTWWAVPFMMRQFSKFLNVIF